MNRIFIVNVEGITESFRVTVYSYHLSEAVKEAAISFLEAYKDDFDWSDGDVEKVTVTDPYGSRFTLDVTVTMKPHFDAHEPKEI